MVSTEERKIHKKPKDLKPQSIEGDIPINTEEPFKHKVEDDTTLIDKPSPSPIPILQKEIKLVEEVRNVDVEAPKSKEDCIEKNMKDIYEYMTKQIPKRKRPIFIIFS